MTLPWATRFSELPYQTFIALSEKLEELEEPEESEELKELEELEELKEPEETKDDQYAPISCAMLLNMPRTKTNGIQLGNSKLDRLF